MCATAEPQNQDVLATKQALMEVKNKKYVCNGLNEEDIINCFDNDIDIMNDNIDININSSSILKKEIKKCKIYNLFLYKKKTLLMQYCYNLFLEYQKKFKIYCNEHNLYYKY